MTISYFPFDAGPGANSFEDRWRFIMKMMLRDGVQPTYLDGLEPFGDSSGKNVKVRAGLGASGGHLILSDAVESLPIADNTSGDPRVDSVVMHTDVVANTVDLRVLQGVPAVNPSAPTLTRDTAVWETLLGDIAVVDGFTQIDAADVTDRRVGAAPSPWMQFGRFSQAFSAEPSKSGTQGFDDDFPQLPIVLGTVHVGSSLDVLFNVTALTKSGFSWRLFQKDGNNLTGTVTVYWLALG